MSDSEEEIADIINRFGLANFANNNQNLNNPDLNNDLIQNLNNNVNNNQNLNNPNLNNDLIQNLNNNVNNIQEQDNMANPGAVNYQLLRLYIDTIPTFDGNPHTLSIFINNCTSLINNFFRAGDDAHNNFIVRAIIGKLSGRALSLIGSRINELHTWVEVKEALQLSFGDQRNLDCLVQDLIALTPQKSETPYNFGMRCQDARSLIFSKLNSLGLDDAERLIKIRNYEELALKTFIRGLTGQLQNNVRLRNPESLERAMSLVIEEENFIYSQNRGGTLNTQNFKPNQRVTPLNPQLNFSKPINYQNNTNTNFNAPRPPFNIFQRPSIFGNNNNQFQRPMFYNNNNPFYRPPQQNFTPRPFLPQNQFRPNNSFPFQKHPFFTQRQNNQPFNQNRFVPNQNYRNNNNNKVEPMDTSSGQSKLKPAPQQKYTVTELYQQEVEKNEKESQNYPETEQESQNFTDEQTYTNFDYNQYTPEYFNDTFEDQNYQNCDYNEYYQYCQNYQPTDENFDQNINFSLGPNPSNMT